jgi:hypothetical protein
MTGELCRIAANCGVAGGGGGGGKTKRLWAREGEGRVAAAGETWAEARLGLLRCQERIQFVYSSSLRSFVSSRARSALAADLRLRN